jgi:putative MATE family efflux protein
MVDASKRGGAAPVIGVTADLRTLDRDIWKMAWPAMLSFMLTNVVDLIDVAFVGRLGRVSIAAFGYSAQYLQLINTLIQSVGIGCVASMSRAIGASDTHRARESLAAAMSLAFVVAAFAVGLVWAMPETLLTALHAEPQVIDEAKPYFRISALSTLAFSISFSFESGLRSYKLTRVPMKVMVVIAAVKLTATYALVFGKLGMPALGLVGAAWGTVAAHAIGAILYVGAARMVERDGSPMTFGLGVLRNARRTARDVVRVSLPAMGERLVMSLALLAYFALLSDYGTAAVAAYAIGVRLLTFSWVPGLGFSAAASTFVGQSLGARDAAGARRAGARAVRLAVLVMTVLGTLCLFARGPLSRLFTNDAQVVEHLLPFLTMLAISQPFMGAHFTLGGVLRGAGDTVTPLIGAALGNWGFRVPLAYLYAKVLSLSLPWVWSALICDHVARTACNGLAFLRGRWLLAEGRAGRAYPDPASASESDIPSAP